MMPWCEILIVPSCQQQHGTCNLQRLTMYTTAHAQSDTDNTMQHSVLVRLAGRTEQRALAPTQCSEEYSRTGHAPQTTM